MSLSQVHALEMMTVSATITRVVDQAIDIVVNGWLGWAGLKVIEWR